MTVRMRLLLIVLFLPALCRAQDSTRVRRTVDLSGIDTADYEALFNELDALLDSLAAPHSFGLFNLSAAPAYFNYESRSTFLLHSKRKMTYTPTLAYYLKSGLGLSVNAVSLFDEGKLNPYQAGATASYDYLKQPAFITGVALTRFFTKDSLRFYTSPLKNEIYLYFTYKKSWFKPSLALSYGWGSRSAYTERLDYINSLRLVVNGYTRIHTNESVNDFNLVASVRHDIYWLDVLSKSDYIRLTPQLVFTSGTQKFGFNQTSNSFVTIPRTGTNLEYNTDKFRLDDQLRFQPLSLTAYIKGEYAKGHFFMQPQFFFDYYFPAGDRAFTTGLILNAGVIF